MPLIKIALASLLFIGACGTSVSTLQLSPITSPPRPPLSVETFMQPPPRPYINVARLEAHDGMSPSTSYMIAKLRERAAQLGCDGIIIEPIGHHEDSHHVTHLAGTCIMFAAQTSAAPTR